MAATYEFLSPKQVARALGVSESSLKRWCDQGLIKTIRTGGGHRKLPRADVLRFAREQGHEFVSPEVIGLPPVSPLAGLGLSRSRPRLVEALLAGDEPLARQIVVDLFLARHPLPVIFDEVVAGAFHDIGDRWACHEAEVFQERRGCEITQRLLCELRTYLPPVETGPLALGGTLEGDPYALPSTMAELALRGAGFCATNLGSSLPASTLVRALRGLKPRLFWLSLSYIPEDRDVVGACDLVAAACDEVGAGLIVGGQALTAELRQQLAYSAFGDTMRHLDAFARAWLRNERAKRKSVRRPREK